MILPINLTAINDKHTQIPTHNIMTSVSLCPNDTTITDVHRTFTSEENHSRTTIEVPPLPSPQILTALANKNEDDLSNPIVFEDNDKQHADTNNDSMATEAVVMAMTIHDPIQFKESDIINALNSDGTHELWHQ
jgi:hypothetical protein